MKINCEQIINGGADNTLKPRNESLDSVKYWLIVFPIAGHIFGRKEFSEIPECVIIKQWIYIFHMPLFIFISGYFSRKKEKKLFLASVWKLLEPLLLIQVVIKVLEYISEGTISLKDVLTPWWVMWYLLSLFFWRLTVQIIPDKYLNMKIVIVVSSFCIGIIAGFLPLDRFLSLQRTLAFSPFFILGYCMRGKNLFIPNRYKYISCAFLILTFTLPIFFSQYLGNLHHANPYGNFINVFSRLFVFILSIPMSLAFINICPTTQWSIKQGRLTMQYYIYHA